MSQRGDKLELHFAGLVMNKEELIENVKVDDRLGTKGPGRQAEHESVVDPVLLKQTM